MGIYLVLFFFDFVFERFIEWSFLYRKEFYKLINVSKIFLKFDFIKNKYEFYLYDLIICNIW